MKTTKEGPSRRSIRMSDQIMRELALMLIEEMQDPRLDLVTISGVRLLEKHGGKSGSFVAEV